MRYNVLSMIPMLCQNIKQAEEHTPRNMALHVAFLLIDIIMALKVTFKGNRKLGEHQLR